ncbi:hypothetical protein RB653_003577 [Dictyostelium firmibasis]|uniref:Uncharacterized protein n=1 Tax=Dictyostelium firmibasis TaxID=79012 RepID=A0AAN7U605_9MYCE
MKELKEELNNVKSIIKIETYIQTGNLIIESSEDKIIIRKEVTNILSEKFNVKDPQMAIYTIEEYKDIISSTPFELSNPKSILVLFPTQETLEQSVYETEKSEMTSTSKWELINGIIYYFGKQNGASTEVKVFRTLNKKFKTNPHTGRNFNTVKKMLDLANK